jgi:16S rRNA (cytosine967-C5)-methyltransferase
LSRFHSHITSAVLFLQTVKKGEPLVHQLKRFFATNKKYGSSDRRSITNLCYAYYRLGHALNNEPFDKKILASLFLSNTESNPMIAALATDYLPVIKSSVQKKLTQLQINFNQIFPYPNYLGSAIDKEKFALSFLQQPQFYIRARPLKAEQILEKLAAENITFEEVSTTCIALPPATKIDALFKLNKDVVVQDKNSQQVFNYLLQPEVFLPKDPLVWDCCAASGGKSILMHDLLHGNLQLQVSDKRANIINNLRERFKDAGLKNYQAFVSDILNEKTNYIPNKYDIIICDAPCTGSGTWARTPEQLAFFDEKSITEFATLQQQIASKVLPSLKASGLFFYITCSVFEMENEQVVMALKEKFYLQILQMEYLKGYESQADTMFVAVLSF